MQKHTPSKNNHDTSGEQDVTAQSFDEFKACFRGELGLPPQEASRFDRERTVPGSDLSTESSVPDQNAERSTLSDSEDESDAARLAAVEIDIAEAQAKITSADNTPPMPRDDDRGLLWDGGGFRTSKEFEAAFAEIFPEVHPIAGDVPSIAVDGPPIHVTSGIAQATAQPDQPGDAKVGSAARKRRAAVQKRAATALLAWVERDPAYRAAKATRDKQHLRYVAAIKKAKPDGGEIAAALNDLSASVAIVEEYLLTTFQVLAYAMLRCGQYGAFACGSYWCTHCSKRFKARLLEDTQAQLRQRYGDDLEKARDRIVYVTILDDAIVPTPDLGRDYGANFAASTKSRGHIAIFNYLRRLQRNRRSAMSDLLAKRKLSLALVLDWLDVGDRDRTFYSPNNAVADAARLVALSDLIIAARARFKSRRKRPDLERNTLISWRDAKNVEAYMWQLRKAQPLDREDILTLTDGFQFIDREFRGITKTNYPERLKFKSSIVKVIKRERAKLYRLSKDLPGVSLIGVFELELIDLRHAIGGDHQHSVKAKTVRALASQPRKPTKYRKSDEPIPLDTQLRRFKTAFKNQLLDEARARIAANEDLPESKFPGIRYAVLLHMHVVIDLNGTPRGDVERWLTGRGVGTRRFTGQWTLPHQVMIKSLYANKPVEDNLRHISFYPIKAATTFNYENTAPKLDEELAEGDPRNFDDEALALSVWLQHSIGHESLRVAINWPGVDREKRGPKPQRESTPKLADDELERALAAQGIELPRPPVGQTDINFLFEEAGQAAQGASGPAEASRPAERPEDVAGNASGATSDGDSTGGPASDRGDQGGEAEQFNDTTPSTEDG